MAPMSRVEVSRAQLQDADQLRREQQGQWASGNYQRLASASVLIAEQLCEHIDLRSSARVVDLCTGTGNTAIAAARRQCRVTGLDFVPEFLARARWRAAAEGVEVDFVHGDTQLLPFADGAFDVVLSTFGVPFAADHRRAADELVRVCRSGGRIAMTSWLPEGWTGALGGILARYSPPPAPMKPRPKPPFRWSCPDALAELFGSDICGLDVQRRVFMGRHLSAEGHWESFRKAAGWLDGLMKTMTPQRQDDLAGEVVEAMERFNQADDGTLVLPSHYAEVVAVRS